MPAQQQEGQQQHARREKRMPAIISGGQLSTPMRMTK
jgi:hypothetical protein